MSVATVSIRDLRTNFRSVKRKVEQHGEIIITDNGQPAYVMKPVAIKPKKRRPLPNYMARLLKRQPEPMSEKATRELWEYERGDR